jgi:hypothetical protein
MLSKEQFKAKLDFVISSAVFSASGTLIKEYDELCATYAEVVEALGDQPVDFMPFDLERAKRGESIQYLPTHADVWHDCHFVGVTASRGPVIEAKGSVFEFPVSNLRMAPPEMRTVYINVYRDMSHGAVHVTEERAREFAADNVVHIAYPVKIPVVK